MIIGVVGKPNCGKSTFFKAATLQDVKIANYPFATIEPNEGVGYVKVKDPAMDFGKVSNPREGYVAGGFRFVPVKLIDVAGLVPDAHKGLGMGNKFLDDLRQADALIHVIDISGSTNAGGEPVPRGSYDPAEDVRFLEREIDFWYLGILKKGWDKLARQIQQEKSQTHKVLGKQLSGLNANEKMVEEIINKLKLDPTRTTEWTDDQLMEIAKELRKQTKPMIIAANKIDVPGSEQNLERVRKEFPHHIIVPCSAESELALREASKNGLIEYIPSSDDFKITDESKLTDKQKNALGFIRGILKNYGSTGVQDVLNKSVFVLLRYIALFPGGVAKLEDQHGNVIPDCFLMPPGTTALDFAFRLHTDFGKNFIKAINVRTKMIVGKDHLLKTGDVIEIASGK